MADLFADPDGQQLAEPVRRARPRKQRLTPKMRAVLAIARSGLLIRRRGVFGDHQADHSDGTFAASITIDCLWRAGLLEPGPYWGTYVAKGT